MAELAQQQWTEVFNATSVHKKAENLHKTIETLLNEHCPRRVVKQRIDKPLWMTSSILKLISARQEADERGCPSYKFLRAMVQMAQIFAHY